MHPAGSSCLAGFEQRTNLQSYQKKTCAKLERCFAPWESAGTTGMVWSPPIGSGAAGQPLAHLFQQQSDASMNFFRDKGESSSRPVKGNSFRLHIIPASVNVHRRPRLHEMWPQLGPYIPSYCSEFFSKACNALLPWPQFSLLRKGCKEWIAFFSCYLDKEKR